MSRNVTMQDLKDFNLGELKKILETGTKEEITEALDHWGLEIKGGKIRPREETAGAWDDIHGYFDKLQLTRKISLNSAFFNRRPHSAMSVE